MWPRGLSNPPPKEKPNRMAQENGEWPRQNMDDMRGRHPMFRMPNWFSEDDGIGGFSRMNQPPNWPPFSRRQGSSWNERPNSRGSAGDPVDSVDSHMTEGHTIPIRIEAEAPPGYEPTKTEESKQASEPDNTANGGFDPQMKVGKQPAYASKTTTAVDTCKEEVPRDTRSSSAPPEIDNSENALPQSGNGNTQKFNNVAKPFSSGSTTVEKPPSIPEEQQQPSEQPGALPININKVPPSASSPQPSSANRSQKSSVVRNIPIVVEGRDGPVQEEQRSPRMANSCQQQIPPQQQQQNPQWQQHPYDNVPPEFAQEPMFNDPFFNFSMGSPRMTRQGHPQQYQNQQQPPQQFTQRAPNNQQFRQQPAQQQQQSPPPKPQEPKSVPKNEPPKAKEPPKDFKMDKINQVRASLTNYQEQVNQFNAKEKNKDYLYLDEMLTRCLLELDNIDPDGRDDVRQSRKTLIKDISATISLLDKKASPADVKDSPVPEPMAVDEPVQASEEKKETPDSLANTTTEEPKPTQDQPTTNNDAEMEVDTDKEAKVSAEKSTESTTRDKDKPQDESAQKRAKTSKST